MEINSDAPKTGFATRWDFILDKACKELEGDPLVHMKSGVECLTAAHVRYGVLLGAVETQRLAEEMWFTTLCR